MKAVLRSIKPYWLFLILKGEKTIEVGKNKPNLFTPFTTALYCSKDKKSFNRIPENDKEWFKQFMGKVACEFVCNKIYDITTPADYWAEYLFFAHHGKNIYDSQDLIANEMLKETCLSMQNIIDYSQGKPLYGWHISDLKIYDKPKEISAFGNYYEGNYEGWLSLKRPPQSWCYVEEEKNK